MLPKKFFLANSKTRFSEKITKIRSFWQNCSTEVPAKMYPKWFFQSLHLFSMLTCLLVRLKPRKIIWNQILVNFEDQNKYAQFCLKSLILTWIFLNSFRKALQCFILTLRSIIQCWKCHTICRKKSNQFIERLHFDNLRTRICQNCI